MSEAKQPAEVIFESAPELVDQIFEMPEETSFVLFDERGLGGTLRSLQTEATVVKGEKFDRLVLGSIVGLVEHERDARSVIAKLALAFKKREEHDKRIVDARFDFFQVTDKQQGDAVTHVSALMGGSRGWQIQTNLQHFRYGDPTMEVDRAAIETIIGQHTFALSSLVSILSGENVTDRGPLILAMPEGHDDPEVVTGNSYEQQAGLEQFVGIDSTIEELRDVIAIADMPRAMLRQSGSELVQAVILHGPSGVGKSEIMKSFAHDLQAEVFDISFSALADSLVGEWAKNIEAVFTDAYKSSGRVVIMLDEIDGLIKSGNEGVNGNITSVLKRKLEEIRLHPQVFVVAATNNIDSIDQAVLADKRFQLKVPIQLPNHSERVSLFRAFIVNPQLEGEEDGARLYEIMDAVEGYDFNSYAEQTENFSGGDIREIVKRINRQKLLRAVRSGSETADITTPTEIEAAINHARQNRPQA